MNKIKKGFTLIEMLIVVVIIGILAAALIPRLQGIQGRARDTARMAHCTEIGKAMAVYKSDKGNYSGLATATLAPAYMTSVPTDPQFTTQPTEFTGSLGIGYGFKIFCSSYSCVILGATTETAGKSSNAASEFVTGLNTNSTIDSAQSLICTGTVSIGSGPSNCNAANATELRYYYVQ